MSYYNEHQRFRPVLEKARALDIARNPAPEALFDPLVAVFQMFGCANHSWCTPADRPAGWEAVEMDRGAFSKPCAFVATVTWRWNEDKEQRDASIARIIGLNLTTMAYALRDLTLDREDWWRKQDETLYENRPDDVAWATEKIRWLFAQADVPLPPIHLETD